ncbi:MAG: hypothetical protein WDZ49_05670 [Litorilinea sp.]
MNHNLFTTNGIRRVPPMNTLTQGKFRQVIATLAITIGLVLGTLPSTAHADHLVSAEILRAELTAQLGEHVLLAGTATNAALHGNNDEFEVAAQALDGNSQDLAASIGAVYGQDAADAFLALWRTHIDMFVEYTLGVATADKVRVNQALDELNNYRTDFGAFIAAANPNLTRDAIAEALIPHVRHLTAMINAQAEGDYTTAYRELRMAYGHSSELGLVLAWAIAEQFPDRFPGQADASAVDLRILLSSQLAEHTFLAAMATNAALQGFNDDFEAAAGAVDANALDLSASIGSVYGQDAANAFLPLWRAHVGMFVDYTLGAAAGDDAAKNAAAAELDGYRTDFGAFISGANPNLPRDVVAEGLKPHVAGLTAAIDAQATGDYTTAYSQLRMVYAHSHGLGAVLAGGIAQQFPQQFMAESMPQQMPATGYAPVQGMLDTVR